MIFKNKKITFIFFIYIIFSSFLLIRNLHLTEPILPKLLFGDKMALDKLYLSFNSDINTKTIFITRAFHNKPVAYLETFSISAFRSIDPVFLFSLSNQSSMYDGDVKLKMLYPIELLFFLIAAVFFVRRWTIVKKRYSYVLPAIILSLLISGIFLPPLNPIKLFPLVLTTRLIIFIGTIEFFKDKL